MTELEKIELAIAKFRDGERVGRVTVNGKTIAFADVTLEELLKLRREELARVRKRKIQVANFRGGKGL